MVDVSHFAARIRGRIFIWAMLGTFACGDPSKSFEITAMKQRQKNQRMCSGSVKIGANVLVNGRETCEYIDPRTLRKTTATAQREPAIAVSGDAIMVQYGDYRRNCPNTDYQTRGWAYSLNGGLTFADQRGVPGATQGDPWLVTGPPGVFYVTGNAAVDGRNGALELLRATVVEPLLGQAKIVFNEPAFFVEPCDRSNVAVDPNHRDRIYASTSFQPVDETHAIHLFSAGCEDPQAACSFSENPITVASMNPSSPQFAVASDGTVYATWKDGSIVGHHRLYFSRSDDQGQTFSAPYLITEVCNYWMPGNSSVREQPSFVHGFAVDTSGQGTDGNLYLAWEESCGLDPGNSNILFSRSSDRGATWSGPIPVNDDTRQAAHGFPTVTVAGDRVDVFFYDRRDNDDPSSTLTHLYMASSIDGGQSFQPNVRVTEIPTLWDASVEGDGQRFGDYISSTSEDCTSYVAWTDGRFGDEDIFMAKIVPADP